MHTTTLLFTALSAAVLVMVANTSECSNAEKTSCLLTAVPSNAVTAGPSTAIGCPDQACVCSAMSLQSECYKTHCKGFDLGADFSGAYEESCGTAAPAGGAVSSGSPTTTDAGAITSAPGGSSVSTTVPSSTSVGGVEGVARVMSAGGLLAVFLGVIVNL